MEVPVRVYEVGSPLKHKYMSEISMHAHTQSGGSVEVAWTQAQHARGLLLSGYMRATAGMQPV